MAGAFGKSRVYLQRLQMQNSLLFLTWPGELDCAFKLFDELKADGKLDLDEIVYNSLLDGCGRKQKPQKAMEYLQDMISTSGSIVFFGSRRFCRVHAFSSLCKGLPWKHNGKVTGLMDLQPNLRCRNSTLQLHTQHHGRVSCKGVLGPAVSLRNSVESLLAVAARCC